MTNVLRTSGSMLFGISELMSMTCRALLSFCLVSIACEMLFIRWVIRSLLGMVAHVKVLLYCCGGGQDHKGKKVSCCETEGSCCETEGNQTIIRKTAFILKGWLINYPHNDC